MLSFEPVIVTAKELADFAEEAPLRTRNHLRQQFCARKHHSQNLDIGLTRRVDLGGHSLQDSDFLRTAHFSGLETAQPALGVSAYDLPYQGGPLFGIERGRMFLVGQPRLMVL
jgi:hypothetical protein